jgi:hypothetical protein
MNYISLVVLLFYVKNKREYEPLRRSIEVTIKEKFKAKKMTLRKDTELTLLLFDCVTCPYLSLETKREIFSIYGITDMHLQEAIIKKQKYWFTKWTAFDFGKELDAKQSRDVY